MRPVTMSEIGRLVEQGYLQRGAECYERGEVKELARCRTKLFGEVREEHRATVEIDEFVKAACSCKSSRRTPFCKHATALLIAWAKTPEAFREVEREPSAPAKPARMKRGKADIATLVAKGLAELDLLLAELARTGLAAVTKERIAEVKRLAEDLRHYKLRRLAARLAEFHALLSTPSFPLADYASGVADLVFMSRAVAAIQAGRITDEARVEEYVGRTWNLEKRPKRSGLSLLEIHYERQTTPDGFRVDASWFVDLPTGEILTEKLIVPASLRTPPKRSWRGEVVEVREAREFPGFPPHRLSFAAVTTRPATPEDFAAVRPTDSAAELFERYRRLREDVLGPDELHALVRPAAFVTREGALFARDADRNLLPLRGGAGWGRVVTAGAATLLVRIFGGFEAEPLSAIVGTEVVNLRARPSFSMA